MRHDEAIRDHLEQNLPLVAPHLFTLTDRVIEAAGDRPWDIFVGDDTNCRLPVYFIRHALERARGERVKTFFINGSRIMREELPATSYAEYIEAQMSPVPHGRVLIVSEAVDQGNAMRSLKAVTRLALPDALVEAAAVASTVPRQELLEYVGAEGDEAVRDVFLSLESVARDSLSAAVLARARKMVPQIIKDHVSSRAKNVGQPRQSGSALTGLYTPKNPRYPVSAADRVHSIRTAYDYMDGLLDVYSHQRSTALTVAQYT